jgi:hypothetical protein
MDVDGKMWIENIFSVSIPRVSTQGEGLRKSSLALTFWRFCYKANRSRRLAAFPVFNEGLPV